MKDTWTTFIGQIYTSVHGNLSIKQIIITSIPWM